MKSDLLRCDQQSGNLDFDLQPGPVEPFLLGTDITVFKGVVVVFYLLVGDFKGHFRTH